MKRYVCMYSIATNYPQEPTILSNDMMLKLIS